MLIQGDAVHIPLPDQSVHCAITSPPYWGLRKYAGVQGRIWGGDPECEHEWGAFTTDPVRPVNRRCEKCQKFGVSIRTTEDNVEIHCSDCNHITYTTSDTRGIVGIKGKKPAMSNLAALEYETVKQGQFCQLCGAWYGSLGLEPTPEQHTENIVEVCREVRRVLRDDGVFWLNYGDCYTAQGGHTVIENDGRSNRSKRQEATGARVKGLAQGNLMMMPHRVALALQQDGWIVRQDLVWFKRNPMPESVNGWRWQSGKKCSCFEYDYQPIGILDESDQKGRRPGAMDKPMADPDCPKCHGTGKIGDLELKRGSWRHTRAHEYVFQLVKGMQYFSNQEAVREKGSGRTPGNLTYKYDGLPGHETKQGILAQSNIPQMARNPRSVLDVPTAPYKGAHYATFPPNLIAPLIRATCPRWACPVCGQGWAAVVEKGERIQAHWEGTEQAKINTDGARGKHGATSVIETGSYQSYGVIGYRPTCEHEHTQEEAVPGIVFDPFVGSGTTVMVAQNLLRRGIGLDISRPYLNEQAKVRTGTGSPPNQLKGLPLFDEVDSGE